jgi:hypothetical protein
MKSWLVRSIAGLSGGAFAGGGLPFLIFTLTIDPRGGHGWTGYAVILTTLVMTAIGAVSGAVAAGTRSILWGWAFGVAPVLLFILGVYKSAISSGSLSFERDDAIFSIGSLAGGVLAGFVGGRIGNLLGGEPHSGGESGD